MNEENEIFDEITIEIKQLEDILGKHMELEEILRELDEIDTNIP
jgi:hypothetical protein